MNDIENIKSYWNEISKLTTQRDELLAKVAELESRIVSEPVKWQPKGGNFFIQSNGKMSEVVGGSDTPHKEFGVERPERQQAERAAVEMRRFNRLLALRDELCGDEVVNWSSNDSKFYIHFHTTDKVWFVGLEFQCQFIMPYFTTQETAQKACDMLNSGEVEL